MKAQGRIYIASAFTNLKYSKCKSNKEWLDNDPHFWGNSAPTWGICRTDFRKQLNTGDYIFYVLPKNIDLPQMIFGYIKILENITHIAAYKRFPYKRMGNKNPNGNIIVDKFDNYNKYDYGIHKKRFEQIKKYYIVGDKANSRLLEPNEIQNLSMGFLNKLNEAFNTKATNIFAVVGRKGRVLNEKQINILLNWLH